jgi:hypothetical protein
LNLGARSNPRMKIDPEHQQAVDRLLLEQSDYQPLELLMAEGRLMQADYQAWCQGELEHLEQALFGDPERVVELLRQAADYLQGLGRVAHPLEYRNWAEGRDTPLRFSRQRELDRLFHTGYGKAAGRPQLDLFLDNAEVVLVEGIVRALRAGDLPEARRQWEQLLRQDPSHPELGGLERLIAHLAERARPLADIPLELQRLDQEIEPLARRHLGAGARDFLVPAWGRLAAALRGQPFDPAQPQRHASHAALRAEDWPGVLAAVQGEPPALPLLRCALRAQARLRREVEHLGSWFAICWRHPQAAEGSAGELLREWRPFWQEFLALDPELAVEDFPAWLLTRQPALGRRLPSPDQQAPASYRAVWALLQAATQPAHDLAGLRRTLQEAAPLLFQHYMRGIR